MKYKIVVDSCCELPEALKHDERFESIPLGLELGDYRIEDDENFNQIDFLKRIAESPKAAKSSCPSPQTFMNAFRKDVDHIYVVTLSARLSGSYNSAELAKGLFEEEYGAHDIYIVDSKSASCGETQIALKLMELEEQGMAFADICSQINTFVEEMNTYFVLDNLETLRKNGRLTGVKALVASKLNIKPIMGAEDGAIIQLGQSIGIRKALQKMVEEVCAQVKDPEHKRVIIANCNCEDRAAYVKKMLEEKMKFSEILITNTAGISSMYANDGGIIVTV